MRIISKILIAAMLATSTVTTAGVVLSTESEAASKRVCRDYARRKADQKVARRVVRDTAVGALGGLAIGALVGGHHSKRRGALIGGGVGLVGGSVAGNGRWQRTYDSNYAYCRENL
jgi:uncharacterized protein YcfJ